jgi:L-aminopeptidase/D-esterase-like protein
VKSGGHPSAATPAGSITDVPGLRVGHHQRTGRGWQTGTTAVIVPAGAVPGVDVRGGGPGTRETDALAPQNLVDQVHGVCLSGGSAYGLATADGVMAWLEERNLGFPIGSGSDQVGVVPVVPAAVIFDLGRGGQFANRPGAEFGRRAAKAARKTQSHWGSVGAGTGAKAGGLQGGVGTASTIVTIPGEDGQPDLDVTVGALAVVNANGSAVNPLTGLPWERRCFQLRRPSSAERQSLVEVLDGQANPRLNTTIGIVATSAQLTKAEVSKLASVAHDGLARAVRPAHSMFDGDTVFGLATGTDLMTSESTTLRVPGSRNGALNQLLTASADTFATACTHAVLAATTIGDLTAYRDVCPSASRD